MSTLVQENSCNRTQAGQEQRKVQGGAVITEISAVLQLLQSVLSRWSKFEAGVVGMWTC